VGPLRPWHSQRRGRGKATRAGRGAASGPGDGGAAEVDLLAKGVHVALSARPLAPRHRCSYALAKIGSAFNRRHSLFFSPVKGMICTTDAFGDKCSISGKLEWETPMLSGRILQKNPSASHQAPARAARRRRRSCRRRSSRSSTPSRRSRERRGGSAARHCNVVGPLRVSIETLWTPSRVPRHCSGGLLYGHSQGEPSEPHDSHR
jgi:hypothetical protein